MTFHIIPALIENGWYTPLRTSEQGANLSNGSTKQIGFKRIIKPQNTNAAWK